MRQFYQWLSEWADKAPLSDFVFGIAVGIILWLLFSYSLRKEEE